jgi:hypothetical protein
MGNLINELLLDIAPIPKGLVCDSTMSDRARFVYVFMSCQPDGWEFSVESLSKEIGYGVETLRKYVKELMASGWLLKDEEHGTLVLSRCKRDNNSAYSICNINIKNNNDNNVNETTTYENKEEKKTYGKEKKDELFEKCWVTYKRKGSKAKSLEYWKKLTEQERKGVLPHITAYVSSREVHYQKDFERYLRDKVFLTVVFKGSNIIYDPSINESTAEGKMYMPQTGFSLMWNDYYKCFMYTGYWDGHIPDGYTDDNRPDGAEVTLNNSRGVVVWNSTNKKWEKK